MNDKPLAIMWFRQDLRVADNPALCAACDSNLPVVPIYILDDCNAGQHAMGAASRWWLHQSLSSLAGELDGKLQFFCGDARETLAKLCENLNVTDIFWNRCYEPWRRQRDTEIEEALEEAGINVVTSNGSLLFEPPAVTKVDDTPYKVFTPFYRASYLDQTAPPREPLRRSLPDSFAEAPHSRDLEALDLMPDQPWYQSIAASWTPGEAAAHERLDAFLEDGIDGYRDGRDRPDLDSVSRLSPRLHFGELSPNQVWHAAGQRSSVARLEKDVDHFRRELGWREFSYSLLYHWPDLPVANLQSKFDRFPWRKSSKDLARWQQGVTGYPMVDAGMRELWHTGYMHNRVRMIVGSFLVKNLLLHWHHGEAWFWDTLVDADLANNSASWQWIAGCGADAAPFFRIFNAVTQGRKFDPDGSYVRRYVPELAKLPTNTIHAPWEAPADVLKTAGVSLGDNYPAPIVDLKASRERALAAFKSLS